MAIVKRRKGQFVNSSDTELFDVITGKGDNTPVAAFDLRKIHHGLGLIYPTTWKVYAYKEYKSKV